MNFYKHHIGDYAVGTFIGIELNEANDPLQRERLRQPPLALEAM